MILCGNVRFAQAGDTFSRLRGVVAVPQPCKNTENEHQESGHKPSHIILWLDFKHKAYILVFELCHLVIASAMPLFSSSLRLPGHGFRCLGGRGSGCTGRIGAFADGFIAIGGYDQGMYPSGYQDIDLYLRLRMRSGGYAPKYKFECGESIPNYQADNAAHHNPDHLRGKMANVSKEFNLSWGQMNTFNMGRSKRPLNAGEWWRNITAGQTPPHSAEVAAGVCVCVRHYRRRADAAEARRA